MSARVHDVLREGTPGSEVTVLGWLRTARHEIMNLRNLDDYWSSAVVTGRPPWPRLTSLSDSRVTMAGPTEDVQKIIQAVANRAKT